MADGMEKNYDELKKRYDLPEFHYMDHEFEINTLDGEKFLLRAIKDKMVTKIDDYVKIMEDVLNPDSSSYSSIYETRTLSEKDKGIILRVHQKFMILLRKALYISIDNIENEIAGYIKEATDMLESVKPSIKKLSKSLQKAWEAEDFEEERQHYMG